MNTIFRVIQINPAQTDGRQFYKSTEDLFYTWGMGNLINYKIIERKLDIICENWRLDFSIHHELAKTINGMHCRVFPAQKFFIFSQFSFRLIHALYIANKMAKKNKIPLVLHFHGLNNLFFSLLNFFFRKIPMIISHHGGANFNYKRKKLKNTTVGKFKSYLGEIIDKFALRNIDAIILQTDFALTYFKSNFPKLNILRTPVAGIYSDRSKIIDREQARIKLGFPINKKIILQVGRAFKNRGVQYFIEVFDKLKTNSDYYFYMVDVQEKDELYADIKKSGIFFTGKVDHDKLFLYYNAADVVVYAPFGEMDLNFAGTSFVPLESLVCGTPVIATTLRHFPDNEIINYARIPKKPADIFEMLIDLIEAKIDRQGARDLVLKYYNWDYVIDKHLELYTSILNKHA